MIKIESRNTFKGPGSGGHKAPGSGATIKEAQVPMAMAA